MPSNCKKKSTFHQGVYISNIGISPICFWPHSNEQNGCFYSRRGRADVSPNVIQGPGLKLLASVEWRSSVGSDNSMKVSKSKGITARQGPWFCSAGLQWITVNNTYFTQLVPNSSKALLSNGGPAEEQQHNGRRKWLWQATKQWRYQSYHHGKYWLTAAEHQLSEAEAFSLCKDTQSREAVSLPSFTPQSKQQQPPAVNLYTQWDWRYNGVDISGSTCQLHGSQWECS